MNTVATEVPAAPAIETKSVTVKLIDALKSICDLDAGSNREADRYQMCEAIAHAQYCLQCANGTADASGAWCESEAPKDRPIVAMGKIMVEDDFSTAAIPFCSAIEWKEIEGHADWYLFFGAGEYPMALRRALDEKVIIHSWQEFPVSKTKVTVV